MQCLPIARLNVYSIMTVDTLCKRGRSLITEDYIPLHKGPRALLSKLILDNMLPLLSERSSNTPTPNPSILCL